MSTLGYGDGWKAAGDAVAQRPWEHEDEGFMGCGQVWTMGEHVMTGWTE